MSEKRIVNVIFTVFAVAVLLAVLYAVRLMIHRITLERAASQISKKYFNNSGYVVKHSTRQIVFAENELELLKKHKLQGRVVFTFPVKFFELPWQVNLSRISVEGVQWELDLKNRKVKIHVMVWAILTLWHCLVHANLLQVVKFWLLS